MNCLMPLAALALGMTAGGVAAAAPIAWIQMTATGAEARLVTEAKACPMITIGHNRFRMTLRASADAAFDNRVCVAELPKPGRSVIIEHARLNPPKLRPGRIVILGDTGCRLKGLTTQHCNDPAAWPFARVAALAAAQKPDLVIHVGDYYYREKPCPDGETRCAGSPFGDRWPTWKAELFDPAAPLLAAAPWVFVRGNHEDCKRGGAGWFRMLDAAPKPRVCPAQADTFIVDIGGTQLAIVDSADTDDILAPAPLVAAFAQNLPITHGKPKTTWIVTHRPIWDSIRLGPLLNDGIVNATEREAVRGRTLAGVQLILSGHVHNFTSLDFGVARPAQLIVGTGGDIQEGIDTPPPATGTVKIDALNAQVFTMGRFGYFVFDRQGAVWAGAFHDLTDRIVATCQLQARSLRCSAAKPAPPTTANPRRRRRA